MAECVCDPIQLGIIGAMQVEVEELLSHMTEKKERTVSGITFTEGHLSGKRVVVAKCGVGKVFAAVCAQTMMLCYAPPVIINTGVAGSMTDRLTIGQVAVAEGVVQHDMDTSPLGDPVGLLSGVNIITIPTDHAATQTLALCVRELGVHCETGVIATGDQFIASEAAKERIRKNFAEQALVACDMESAAIGQACYLAQTPFAILRAISDGGNERSFQDYPTFLRQAAHIATAAVERFVETL